MATVYKIVNWNDHFENNRTRDMKVMAWIPLPNKQDGDGYTELLDHPNGAAHYGAWVAILAVASKCDPRGTLLRKDRTHLRSPHDAASLARMTRIPAKIITEALSRLVHIGWMETSPFEINVSQEGAEIPQAGAPLVGATPQEPAWNGIEGKGIEENIKTSAALAARVEMAWRIEQAWDAHLAQWRGFHEDVDGRLPGGPPPTLTEEIHDAITRSLRTFDKHLLAAADRPRWLAESKTLAAGVGLYLDTWCTARHKDNQLSAGGKRYLEHWRPWKKLHNKPDPVEKFSELYFQAKTARGAA